MTMNQESTEGKDDFIRDGLLHCGNCGAPKQRHIDLFGVDRIVRCNCPCEVAAREKEDEEREARERMSQISLMRSTAIQSPEYRRWTFAKDDGKNPEKINLARRYVERWEDIYRENGGLLLWGDVGTGKTFFAACIANALIDQMVSVMMTNFTRMSEVMGFDGINKYMAEMRNYSLLVIDDLGAERQSDYMLERVYSIIDARYRDRKPVIITTNLTLQEIKNPKDLKYKRIYDRVLEMCVPVRFTGESRRREKHEEKKRIIRELFQDKEENHE